ncbi:MAG: hypothetical protein ACO3YO_02915 [Chthoniobacterales bacterium]|jgi:hypothetical protein
MAGLFSRREPVATVAFNVRPRSGPYGGANQWAAQLTTALRRAGYRIVFNLRPDVDLVMGTHLGLSGQLAFSWEEVADAKKRNPGLRVVQRINDNDVRKGTRQMADVLSAANAVADHTVFVSTWLRDHHSAIWFDRGRPHSVIEPGADPAVFHPIGQQPWKPGKTLRLVTHHWSDNPAKGFDVYGAIDAAIAEGRLPDCEFRMIGRWPQDLVWRAARTFPPASGPRLAELLRECHVYVTASRYEPGAMHPVEGVQCGLPLLYHADTGGTVALGERLGILLGADPVGAIAEVQRRYGELHGAVLEHPPSGDTMCTAYRCLIQRSIAVSHSANL